MSYRTVAALYIDPLGPYPKLEDVECWDKSRDARLYDGPGPVVAHPPCAPWSKMRWLSSSAKRHLERECAPRALEQVRKFGGVLEHPEHSTLWGTLCLPLPWVSDARGPDVHGGRSYRVEQVAWGHACTKPTWLYIVGVPHDVVVRGIRFGGVPTHCVTRGPGQEPRLRVAHSTMRSRSPKAFAEWLVSLARESRA
jgi:hypothetical protein